jgi:cytochrome P450
MEFEVKRWLYRLLEQPGQVFNSLEDMASKIMCQLAWDDPEHSEYLATSAWGLLTQMSPGGPITNVLTPLWDYLPEPINPWKYTERKRHDEQNAWWMERHLTAREQNERGQLRHSWAKRYFDSGDHVPLSSDHEASCAIGMMALVGVFTVAGPLSYFIMAMVNHPMWALRCQKEIDNVCGDHPPALKDCANLPVLRACIKETMRWRPNVPTGKY